MSGAPTFSDDTDGGTGTVEEIIVRAKWKNEGTNTRHGYVQKVLLWYYHSEMAHLLGLQALAAFSASGIDGSVPNYGIVMAGVLLEESISEGMAGTLAIMDPIRYDYATYAYEPDPHEPSGVVGVPPDAAELLSASRTLRTASRRAIEANEKALGAESAGDRDIAAYHRAVEAQAVGEATGVYRWLPGNRPESLRELRASLEEILSALGGVSTSANNEPLLALFRYQVRAIGAGVEYAELLGFSRELLDPGPMDRF